MKSPQTAGTEPRIKSVHWWHSIGAAFLTVVFCLGLAVTVEAKKPVKPPPEPPPPSEGGIIYAKGGRVYQEAVYQIELLPNGAVVNDLFPIVGSNIMWYKPGPSEFDHDGRWFASAELPYAGESRPMYVLVPEPATWVAPRLMAIHETGTPVELITETSGTVFYIDQWSPPRWFNGDSKIAFLAQQVNMGGKFDEHSTACTP